jgi:hypothetical protein
MDRSSKPLQELEVFVRLQSLLMPKFHIMSIEMRMVGGDVLAHFNRRQATPSTAASDLQKTSGSGQGPSWRDVGVRLDYNVIVPLQLAVKHYLSPCKFHLTSEESDHLMLQNRPNRTHTPHETRGVPERGHLTLPALDSLLMPSRRFLCFRFCAVRARAAILGFWLKHRANGTISVSSQCYGKTLAHLLSFSLSHTELFLITWGFPPPHRCDGVRRYVAPPARHFTVTAESFSEIKSFPRAKWRAVALGCTSIQKQRSSALARPSGCCTRPSATENASAVQQELPLQRRARAALHCTDAVMMEDERGDARFVLAGLA